MVNKTRKDEVTFEEKFNDYGEYENNTGEDYTISSIDTAPNYEDYDYEKEDNSTLDLVKRLSIAVAAIVLIIVIILLLIKACAATPSNKENDLEDKLLKAGKEYYELMQDDLPTVKGTCSTVTLSVLKDLDYLGEEFNTCDESLTYVKVCMLESGNYHYLPIMECAGDENDTKFDEFKEGSESDLVADKSDVKFEYNAEYLADEEATYGKIEELWKDEITYDNYKTISVTNYYRYRDKEYTWTLRKRMYYPGDVLNASDLNTYYTAYPANNYINKTAKTVVYRWYTIENKEYYPQYSGYAAQQPSGYPYYDESESVAYVYYRTRNWVETTKPTVVSPQKMYVCTNPNIKNAKYYSYEECSLNANPKYNEGYTVTDRILYTCDNGMSEVSSNVSCYSCPSGSALKSDNSSCGNYSTWSSWTINGDFSPVCNVKNTDTCDSQVIVMNRWYKGEKKSVGNTSPTGQNPYYAESPVSGAIKDTTTKTTGYKWYKLVNTTPTTEYYATSPQQDATPTDDYKWGSWTKYSTTKPETKSGSREIETKVKVKLKQILSSSSTSWKKVSDTYLSEEELIKKLQDLGYNVNTIEDVSLNGDIKLTIKLYHRDRI